MIKQAEWLATQRVIGIGSIDQVHSAAIVLIETDGRRVRVLETQGVRLMASQRRSTAHRTLALADYLLQFMGNLTLQPFALDVVGLAASVAGQCDAALLSRHIDVAVMMPCDVADPRDAAYAAQIAAYLAACNQPQG
jgi:hypothetical protein